MKNIIHFSCSSHNFEQFLSFIYCISFILIYTKAIDCRSWIFYGISMVTLSVRIQERHLAYRNFALESSNKAFRLLEVWCHGLTQGKSRQVGHVSRSCSHFVFFPSELSWSLFVTPVVSEFVLEMARLQYSCRTWRVTCLQMRALMWTVSYCVGGVV